jgi:hypothetical protein
MMKKIIAGMVMSAAFLVTAPAQASPTYSLEHMYTQCGFGGIIFGRISPVIATVANFLTTFGVTAVLSDVLSPQVCGGQIAARAVFIKENFPSIEQDLASGRGEHLMALNSLMACPAASNHLRADYARYALGASYQKDAVSDNREELFSIVNNNIDAAGCAAG